MEMPQYTTRSTSCLTGGLFHYFSIGIGPDQVLLNENTDVAIEALLQQTVESRPSESLSPHYFHLPHWRLARQKKRNFIDFGDFDFSSLEGCDARMDPNGSKT